MLGKTVASFAVLAAVAVGWPSAASAQASYRVGIYNLAPFGGDPPGGYCFDLVNAMADRLDWQVEFVPMSATDLVTRLAAGDVDLECSALAATNARRQQGIVFSSPILTNMDGILVRADDNTPYATLADLRDLRMGAPVNSAFLQSLQNAGFTDIKTYPGVPEAIAAIEAGEIDAFITISSLFAYNHNVLGMWPAVKLVETWVPTSVNYGAIAVQTGNTALLGEIQNAIEGMKLDGTLATIIANYGLPAPPF